MLYTVAYHQIIYLKHHIIARYLIEYSLCNHYIRCFVFYNHLCTKIATIKHSITTFSCPIQLQLYFISH